MRKQNAPPRAGRSALAGEFGRVVMTALPPLDSDINEDADASESGATTSATFEIGFEYVNPANVDQARLGQALTPLSSIPLTGNVRVVVTSDMAESLASRVQSSYSGPFR